MKKRPRIRWVECAKRIVRKAEDDGTCVRYCFEKEMNSCQNNRLNIIYHLSNPAAVEG